MRSINCTIHPLKVTGHIDKGARFNQTALQTPKQFIYWECFTSYSSLGALKNTRNIAEHSRQINIFFSNFGFFFSLQGGKLKNVPMENGGIKKNIRLCFLRWDVILFWIDLIENNYSIPPSWENIENKEKHEKMLNFCPISVSAPISLLNRKYKNADEGFS